MASLCEGEPPRKVCVPELASIPVDYTAVDFLKKVIAQSNAESNPKRRYSKGIALYGEGIRRAIKEGDLDAASDMAIEAVCKKGLPLKAASTIAPLLYTFFSKSKFVEGEALYEALVTGVIAGHDGVAAGAYSCDIFDDAVSTVAIRILNAQKASADRITQLLERVPEAYLKRRIVHEILDVAMQRADILLASRVFAVVVEHSLELWDCDYVKILHTLAAVSSDDWPNCAQWPSAVAAVDALLSYMTDKHPVVGRQIATIIQGLGSSSKMDAVDSATGQCRNCDAELCGFTLTDGEFAQLADDIVTKLVVPSLPRRSHYESIGADVAEEEIRARQLQFEAFQHQCKTETFDAVIDGANVGYYGVTNWYPKAKKELLMRSGRDEKSITYKEMSEMPLPVDVCPNFEAVQLIREQMVELGYTPKIIFHERHMGESPRLFGRNAELLHKWKEEGAVLQSPAFLNDDYCWLYACITRRDCVIVSNDLMRDHHFRMLSQRSFIRWRQRHRITFKVGHNGVGISVPSHYSTWVQRVEEGGSVWHVPYLTSDVLDQATNKKKPSDALGKDGDDDCAGWLCVDLK